MTQTTTATTHARSHKLSTQPTLAVYAPFGSDVELSTFPDGTTTSVSSHPLVRHLCTVADTGVNVFVLFDRANDGTWLVQIPAHGSKDIVLESQGTLDMLSQRTLADFVSFAHRQFPRASLVLTFEGHGAGFLPDLDRLRSSRASAVDGALIEWHLREDGVALAFHGSGPHAGQPFNHKGAPLLPVGNPTMPVGNPTLPVGNPTLPVGNPTLPVGNPTLPVGNPTLPVGNPTLPVGNPTLPVGNPTLPDHMVISTWALGEALRDAGVPKISVIHFNNCFNMSVEVLHTVAPYAEYATGYCNYNFFTAGQAYPGVFRRLAEGDGATAEQVAKWFAEENHLVLSAAGHEPTVAGTVELARMAEIASRVDELSDALLAVLRGASAEQRPIVVGKIQQAIVESQQYDSRSDYVLAAPDELTDLDSLATELLNIDFGPGKIAATADSLRSALAGIKQYGDDGAPWMAPNSEWNFSSKNLAMNIFLPDPLLNGLWDWRSQFYLDVNPDPARPQRQRHVIDFLKETDWVDFLIEYHKDTPLVGLLPAQLPAMPMVHTKTDPRRRRTQA